MSDRQYLSVIIDYFGLFEAFFKIMWQNVIRRNDITIDLHQLLINI